MEKKNPERSLLAIVAALLLLFVIKQWEYVLWLAIGISFFGAVSQWVAQKIDYLWWKLSKVLGYIFSNILLTSIFYLLLFPVAILSRWFGEKDVLSLKNNRKSLFHETKRSYSSDSFENPW